MKISPKLYTALIVILSALILGCSEDKVPDMDNPDLIVKENKMGDGTTERIHYWKDTIRHGKYEAVYPDGKIEREGYFYLNKMVGEWKFYRTDGSMSEKCEYSNNDRNGLDSVFYPDGQLERAGVYTQDKQNGPWYYYWPNGQLKNEIIYDMEKPIIGSSLSFDSLGNLLTDTMNNNF